jgi:pyruvate dehydrogenase E1 component beta subunit
MTASLEKSRIIREGNEITVVATGELVLEALEASKWLETQGLSVEVIDLRTVNPIDWETIFESIDNTKRLLVCDSSHATCSVGSEIVARVSREKFESLIAAPALLAKPDLPEPTSLGLTKDFATESPQVVEAIGHLMGLKFYTGLGADHARMPHDVPGSWFAGPF